MKTLIKGGLVVNATGTVHADILIDGEQIVALLAPGDNSLGVDVAGAVDTVIDATGKYVIPGGIDAHTHMQMPFGGTEASDTFETGTRAAALGGRFDATRGPAGVTLTATVPALPADVSEVDPEVGAEVGADARSLA